MEECAAVVAVTTGGVASDATGKNLAVAPLPAVAPITSIENLDAAADVDDHDALPLVVDSDST